MLKPWQIMRKDSEFREHAIRLVLDSGWPIADLARDLGIDAQTLRQWVRQAEADSWSSPRSAEHRDRGQAARPQEDHNPERGNGNRRPNL